MKPTRKQAHSKALKEAKLLKGVTPSQWMSYLRRRFHYWLERMGL